MNTPHPNIFLIGLMGAGKTTLGRQLATHLNRPFYDSDQTVCDRTGVSIPTIFELEGESGFRERESSVLDELTQLQTIVLATGGGVILREDNRQYLRQRGTVIYLHVPPDILVERTRNDRNRPLLQVEDPFQRIRDLYVQRDPLYRQTAHITLDIGEEGHLATFEKLLNALG